MFDFAVSLDSVRYVVVDVETTGGTSGNHRIIEVAFCVIEDGEIVRRYESLVQPHQEIPDFIELMTGITNDMVQGAPEEDIALAPLVDELWQDNTVFVAHNVGFDWRFISEAIQRMGEPIAETPTFCTCKLSRRISTGLPKHDLGSMATFYGISNMARHRALGDAEATALAFIKMIEICRTQHEAQSFEDLVALQYAVRKQPRKEHKIRELIGPALKELPDEPGVYYFYGAKKKLLYVGKAKSLRSRVPTYVSDARLHGKSVSRMVRYIREVQWETTGTELGALLLESNEIKTKKPSFNVASREYKTPQFIKVTRDEYPRMELSVTIESDGADYYGPFRSERMAGRILDMIVRTHSLRTCKGQLRPHDNFRPCFEFHVKHCAAPCANLQSKESYQRSVQQATQYLASVHEGAVSALRTQMEEASDAHEFERAAMLRDGIREIERVTMHGFEIPLAVSETSVVLVIPTADRYKTVEVFALHAGRLKFQRVLGLKANLQPIAESLVKMYAEPMQATAFTDRELDELRIITSWLYSRKERVHSIVITNQDEYELLQQLQTCIGEESEVIAETLKEPEAEYPSEYSQIPEIDEGYA